MTEAAPTVTAKSAAICGSSESAERTIDWAAKPATASSTMARVWDGDDVDGEGASTGYPGERRRGYRRGSPDAHMSLHRQGIPATHTKAALTVSRAVCFLAGKPAISAHHDRQ